MGPEGELRSEALAVSGEAHSGEREGTEGAPTAVGVRWGAGGGL